MDLIPRIIGHFAESAHLKQDSAELLAPVIAKKTSEGGKA